MRSAQTRNSDQDDQYSSSSAMGESDGEDTGLVPVGDGMTVVEGALGALGWAAREQVVVAEQP